MIEDIECQTFGPPCLSEIKKVIELRIGIVRNGLVNAMDFKK